MATPTTYKLVLIGDSQCGKSTFLYRHLTGEFQDRYVPTPGVRVHPLVFETSSGQVHFDIWDIAGKSPSIFDERSYLTNADGAIIFFDFTSMPTYLNASRWYNKFKKECPEAPVVLCGSKIDRMDRKVSLKKIHLHRQLKIPFYPISGKSNYNFEKPFLSLARHLLEDPDLRFVDSPQRRVGRSCL